MKEESMTDEREKDVVMQTEYFHHLESNLQQQY